MQAPTLESVAKHKEANIVSTSRPKFPGFDKGRRKAVKLSQENLVRTSYLDEERKFPLVVEPNVESLNPLTYAAQNREFLEAELTRHGAILLRGFNFSQVEEFEAFIGTTSSGALEYTERSSPRSQVAGKIYTSTDYDPRYPIFLHNEQSYNLVFPRKISFFAVTPAAAGGATPIADCRKVLAAIPQAVRKRFAGGYRYVRNFGDGFGLAWQEAFQTTERAAVEAYCRENEIRFAWKDDGRLRTWQVRPCVAKHPRSGEETWFNHLTFFHVSTLVAEVREALMAEFEEEELPNNTYYADGSRIEPEILSELRSTYERETVRFKWCTGDVLMLDNMLSAHGREPYQGERKVVVGMAEALAWTEVAA